MIKYFNSFETTANKIWSSGSLSVETKVSSGIKGKDDVRLDAIYTKSYNSQKYSNKKNLKQVYDNPAFWLVFSYNSFEPGSKPEEIWCSYRQVEIIQDFFNDVLETIQNDIDKIYIKGRVSKKYEEVVWETEPLTKGYSLAIRPTTMEIDGNLTNAVEMLIVDSDREFVGEEVTLSHFLTLINIISGYNLYTAGHLVWVESLLIQLLSKDKENNEEEEESSGYNKSRGIGRRLDRKFTRNTLNKSSIKNLKNDEEEIEEEEDEGNEEETVVSKNPPKKAIKKASNSSTKKTSLDDMIASAEEIELDELNDDDDDDDKEF